MSYVPNVGDLVWAKMKGFSPWPARICDKEGQSKKGHKWVYFFGTHNYAWIEPKFIHQYAQFKEKFSKCKTHLFKEGLEEIEEFIVERNKDPNYEWKVGPALEDSIEESEQTPTPKKPKAEKRRSESSIKTSAKKIRKSPVIKRESREENGLNDSIHSHVSNELLNIPAVMLQPISPTIDINNVSKTLKEKKIYPSNLAFGFLGIGVMGGGMIKNLINSGHRVNIWNRTPKKCEDIKAQADATNAGVVETYSVPCDVVQNSDIIFCCVSDPLAAKEMIYGNCGVLHETDSNSLDGKGYVEMTGIDPETSKVICNMITSRGGRYLEAQVQGSKKEADEGSLVVLAAGDQTLFYDCQTCFEAIGKTAFYLGDVGYATKMNLIIQLIKSVALVGLAEGLVLADRSGLSSKDTLEIFNLTSISCPYLKNKAEVIIKKDFNNVEQALQYMQKDVKLALDLSDKLKQPLAVAATANEVFKHARRLGYDGHDAACVYMRARH